MKMSGGRSWGSLGGVEPAKPMPPDVVKTGYLKKFKTMKKKFFVLRKDSTQASARLEYYDSEKKFRANQPAKRNIVLKTCFNINKLCDKRQKHVVALYTKDECFCIVLETEEEQEEWLKILLSLQQGEDMPDGELPKPTFEHVWQVSVQKKELGNSKNITGPYHLCLTDRTLTLVKRGANHQQHPIEFSLQKIRRCGHLDSFFYMEVGQATVTGAGNLWMQTEDPNIAQNMHDAILSAMTNCSKKGDLVPKSRNRSSSANEASKPIAVIKRWPTTSEGQREGSGAAISPASTSASEVHPHSHSAAVIHQRTYSLPLSPLPPSRRASTGTRPCLNAVACAGQKKQTSDTSSQCLTGVRERSDSMPGRARTTSEGAHHVTHHPLRHLAPYPRPSSMHFRGMSYSPPVGSSPVSPTSGAYSTDSAGSSLSMDGDGGEGGWGEPDLRFPHSLTPDEPVILEENFDDYAPWNADAEEQKLNNFNNYMVMVPSYNSGSIVANLRKYSPNPAGFKSSSPSQGSFVDVHSPYGSSPGEPGAYMPMSPGVGYGGRGGSSSVSHSRGSSLAEDGYVPMAPGANAGYVDMDHGHTSAKMRGESSGSSCSITSGTPSTDIRFSEYNLEKVSTLIGRDRDEDEDAGSPSRPARAYSVGSRPVNINTAATAMARNESNGGNHGEPPRARAFSVGSHAPRPRAILAHTTTPTRHSSHSSVEQSDDMMLIDFSKNKRTKSKKNSFKKPGQSVSSERLMPPSGSNVSSAASSYSTAEESSYMQMSPRSSPKPDGDIDSAHLAPSPPKNSRYGSLIGRSPPKSSFPFERKIGGYLSSSPPVNSPPLYRVPEADSGYVEMTAGSGDELPTIAVASSPPDDDAYLEMKPGGGGGETKAVVARSTQPRLETFPVQVSARTVTATPAIKQPLLTTRGAAQRGSLQEEYLDMSLKRKLPAVEDNNNTKIVVDPGKRTPDGYVEMSWSRDKQQRQQAANANTNDVDYLNMTPGNGKRERRGSRKERNRYSSQPINIQGNKDQSGVVGFPFCARKHSTGTPPKIPSYLPLVASPSPSPSSSPFSSLGRNRAHMMVRRDSKESSTGSGLTTPSGSTTTIFPLNLNSPGSPATRPPPPPDTSDYVNFAPTDSAPSPLPTPTDTLVERVSAELAAVTIEDAPVAANDATASDGNSRLSDATGGAVGETSSTTEAHVSRTSSVSSVGEKELHYASLDLVRSSSEDDTGQARGSIKSTESSSNSTPSPNPALTYAQIDFVASQTLLRH